MIKRFFLIVMDSLGIGKALDAYEFQDMGSDTLKTISKSHYFKVPNLKSIGLFNINGVEGEADIPCKGSYARLFEKSNGKDTTIGHWEIAGIESHEPFPTYPNGFPTEVIMEFCKLTGKRVICNKPYSGTQVLLDYGQEHEEDVSYILYTSADSVFQLAANESVIPVSELYKDCEIARRLLRGEHAVARVIARPFKGSYPDYVRTSNRKDFSLIPPRDTILDLLTNNGLQVVSIGKINDIFAGRGISESYKSSANQEGMDICIKLLEKDFKGLCFINLVDFDMIYGHRRDIDGYARAVTSFDDDLGMFLSKMKEEDALIITADHGCDPGYRGSDHTRESVPLLVYGNSVMSNNNIGDRYSFADIAATIADNFEIDSALIDGTSFYQEIIK